MNTTRRFLGVFQVKDNPSSIGGAGKPALLCTVAIDTDDSSVLGARDIICLAYGDLLDCDELRIMREDRALAKGWIDKPFSKMGAKLLRAGDRVNPLTEASSMKENTTRRKMASVDTGPRATGKGWNPFD